LDERYLGWKLLYGFFPQIEAHFAVWPALMALAGLIVFAMTVVTAVRGGRQQDSRGLFRAVTLVFLGAWTVTFLAFSALDLRVNLLQRHMFFGLPLLALLAGYALAKVDRQARSLARVGPAAVLTGLLVVYLFLDGLHIWADRVLRYVLPPGSG
jgi:hypothetical protein